MKHLTPKVRKLEKLAAALFCATLAAMLAAQSLAAL